ncbi:hypothetical protein FB471_6435 [Amycolatopsis cihanbeyliensis]|uniref:Uncharacterized protein n=1 Tax=Amycolatopsis cihanbeyliensis TaxID=1128664 RepID=A0A542CTZ8_AMYCI|nr:hypothetical protein FB471_6435 [Amycolatopsis cihanbeyliensis]
MGAAGAAVLLALRFPAGPRGPCSDLFTLQFAIPSQTGHYLLCGLDAALALAALATGPVDSGFNESYPVVTIRHRPQHPDRADAE